MDLNTLARIVIGHAWARRLAVIIALIVPATCVNAAVYPSGFATVSAIESYPLYGNGDVIVVLTANSLSATCPGGFWIRGTDPGANRTLAQVLAAQAAGQPITIWADTAVVWIGSAASTCLLQAARTTS